MDSTFTGGQPHQQRKRLAFVSEEGETNWLKQSPFKTWRLLNQGQCYDQTLKVHRLNLKIQVFQSAKGKGQSFAKTVINLFLSEMVSNSFPIIRVPWVAAANWRHHFYNKNRCLET